MDTENSTLQTLETVTPTHIQPPQPTTHIQPPQPTNGVLRRHPPIHIHHFGHPVVVTYKECRKNFAASTGGHTIDGCGEFLLAPTSNLSNPQSLLCDVCGCHRNFHRREDVYSFTQPLVPRNNHVHIARHIQESSDESLPTGPHMLMALSHGLGSGAVLANSNTNTGVGVSRKRYRTKFTQDQKGQMLELAEKVGWKMQKRNESAISESCREIGVEKDVFKVWMHNNKKTVGKKEISIDGVASPPVIVNNNARNDVGLSEGDRGIGDCVFVEEKEHEENVVAGTNDGSSSSAAT